MSSLRLRLFGGVVRPVARSFARFAHDPKAERVKFAAVAEFGILGTPSRTSRVKEPRFQRRGLPGLWIGRRELPKDRVILHLHGGGYLVGSPRNYWKLAVRLARAARAPVFLPPYRLAPESTPLDALEDVRAAWDFLVEDGYAPHRIVLGGDSAGGGLALSLLSGLLAEGIRPGALYLWSPFADQTFSGASVRENATSDHFFPGDRVHDLTKMILGDIDADDPRVSPLFAEFPAPPPALIQASTTEILRDDAVRVAEKLAAAGGDVVLELEEDAPHVWHFFHGWFPEAKAAVARTGTFIRERLRDRSETEFS